MGLGYGGGRRGVSTGWGTGSQTDLRTVYTAPVSPAPVSRRGVPPGWGTVSRTDIGTASAAPVSPAPVSRAPDYVGERPGYSAEPRDRVGDSGHFGTYPGPTGGFVIPWDTYAARKAEEDLLGEQRNHNRLGSGISYTH